MTFNTNDVWMSQTINASKSSSWHTDEFVVEAQESWGAYLMLHIRAQQNDELSYYLDVDKIELTELV
jgi:hypothetical protein